MKRNFFLFISRECHTSCATYFLTINAVTTSHPKRFVRYFEFNFSAMTAPVHKLFKICVRKYLFLLPLYSFLSFVVSFQLNLISVLLLVLPKYILAVLLRRGVGAPDLRSGRPRDGPATAPAAIFRI